MNPLYCNDRPCDFPPSYYVATSDIDDQRPALRGDRSVDVVILGSGYCGLWAALTCARAGLKVAVLEAHRVGFGASGRNGGQAGSAFNQSMQWITKHLGEGRARALWDIAEDGKAQLKEFCASHAPEANWTPGIIHGAWTSAEAGHLASEAEFVAAHYGYNLAENLDKSSVQGIVKSKKYLGGVLDMGGAHIHPLRYVLALAREAEALGVEIYEGTEVTKVETAPGVEFHTVNGVVRAMFGLVAGNGYLGKLHRKVSARTMPINSFIAATEPLGDLAAEILTRNVAVADERFVVNYFRLSEDKRLLFGGRENYRLKFPADIGTRLRARMQTLFPQTKNVAIDYIWGGTLGVSTTRLPCLMNLGNGLLSASGFSGHGVVLAGMAGRVAGEAILGQAERFDVMSQLPTPAFPGGTLLRTPILALAMGWASLRDRLTA